MALSTITSKGQMTLPKEVRDRLNLKPGDRLDVSIQDRRIVLTPKTLHISDLRGVLPRATRRRSLEEMDEAIRQRAVESACLE